MLTIAIDGTMLNVGMECGRKLELAHIQNWRPTEKAEALEKGDLMHRMLAHYYRERKKGRLRNPEQAPLVIGEALEIGRRFGAESELTTAQVDEDIKHFRDHCLFYQQDGWEILEVEQPFSKVMYERPDEFKNGKLVREGLRIIYEGIIDLVVENPSPFGVFVVDHKTSGRNKTPSGLSNQFMGYSWAMGINQIIVNKIGFQKTLTAKDRFQRAFIPYSSANLKEWVANTIYWVHVFEGYHRQKFYPMNLTSCDKYSGCIYKMVCSAHPQVRDVKLMSYYKVGEPWSPHTRDEDKNG